MEKLDLSDEIQLTQGCTAPLMELGFEPRAVVSVQQKQTPDFLWQMWLTHLPLKAAIYSWKEQIQGDERNPGFLG